MQPLLGTQYRLMPRCRCRRESLQTSPTILDGGLQLCTLFDSLCEFSQQLLSIVSADIPIPSCANGKLVAVNLFLADDSHNRNFLHLCVPYLLPKAVSRLVNLSAYAELAGFVPHFVAVAPEILRHRQQFQLCGRQPDGEVARRALRKDAEEALDRPEYRPVDHDGPLLHTLLRHVLEVEPLRQVEVALHRRALPRAPDGVFDFQVDLRSIERPSSLVNGVVPALALESPLQCGLGALPDIIRSDALLRPGAEVYLVVLEPETREDRLGQVQHPHELVLELLGKAEDVRIVLREPPDSHQPVQGPGSFVPVHRAKLCPSDRKFSVRAEAVFVDEAVERAVHRLDLVLLPFHVHLIEHALLVEVEVAGGLPQVQVRDVRGVQELVP
mmetsp:Transcript_34177/g.82782  ORF Transcript_34177/g.82782 Transcript_34177/m.82782 type:complete len:385 (+) Transcript_34177:128-1282(+)